MPDPAQSASQPRYVQLPNGSYLEWPDGVSAEDFKAKAAKVGGTDASIQNAPSMTDNPSGEGTYPMWDTAGKMHQIPFSAVNSYAKQGFKFDTNPIKDPANKERNGLDPSQAYQRDLSYATTGPGHEAEYAASDRNAPLSMQAVSGVVKGIGTLGKPVMDVVGRAARVPQSAINSSLEAQTPMEMAAKVGTMGAAAAPAAIMAPAATAGGLVGGGIGAGAGHMAANAIGASPENAALMEDAGGIIGGFGGAKVGSLVAPSVRAAALGDPNEAALKGLRVGPASTKSLSTIRSVEGARPYLQGVKSLEDLQGRIPAAKQEIWGPYQKTVDAIGGKQVQGPDGPTTVGNLENERLQISANLRTLKQGGPEAVQLATQKGMNQADLLAREKSVQAALDPHLEQAGIDPKLIRQTFGNVAQVGGRVAGKSTMAEPSQPYGFGRMLNLSLKSPRTWIGEPAQGVRDLAAGRPLWSGKPTDINLREAFRVGGAKPDLRAPVSSWPP